MNFKKLIRIKFHYILLTLAIILSILFLIIILKCSRLLLWNKSTQNPQITNKDLSVTLNKGLLLGLREDIDKTTTVYRTLFIVPDKNSFKVIDEVNFIVVPHNKSLWKVEPLRYNFPNTEDFAEYIVAHDIHDDFTPETFEYKFSTYSYKLNFVDNNYVALSTYINNYKNGKSFIEKNCSVVELEKLSNYKHIDDSVNFSDVFSKDGLNIINKYKSAKLLSAECPSKNSINTTSGKSWSIGRQNGQWIPQIAKTFKYSDKNTDYVLYNTPLSLPANMCTYNKLFCNFDSIKNLIPGTLDIISSPDENSLGVFTDTKLTFYAYSKNVLGGELLTVNLKNNENIIMVQWAEQDSIQQWIKSIKDSIS